jgi:hypothetical protein
MTDRYYQTVFSKKSREAAAPYGSFELILIRCTNRSKEKRGGNGDSGLTMLEVISKPSVHPSTGSGRTDVLLKTLCFFVRAELVEAQSWVLK